MQICYIDEAGDTGAFDPSNSLSQPVLVLTGVFIHQEQLAQLTREVMLLKQRFFPNRKNIAPHWHDWLQVEVKGADSGRSAEAGQVNIVDFRGFLSGVKIAPQKPMDFDTISSTSIFGSGSS